MQNITVNAFLNSKEVPPTLYVHGSVITYRADDKVTVTKADPQGHNHTILLLNVTVTEGTGLRKGTPKHLSYESNDGVTGYEKVQLITATGESTTVDIQKFG